MPQRQTVKIPIDNHMCIILDVSVLRLPYSLNGCENVNVIVCAERIERIRRGSHIWIIRFINLLAAIIVKTISWLNQLGRDEIDIKRLEASHNQHLGLRIRGMDR